MVSKVPTSLFRPPSRTRPTTSMICSASSGRWSETSVSTTCASKPKLHIVGPRAWCRFEVAGTRRFDEVRLRLEGTSDLGVGSRVVAHEYVADADHHVLKVGRLHRIVLCRQAAHGQCYYDEVRPRLQCRLPPRSTLTAGNCLQYL